MKNMKTRAEKIMMSKELLEKMKSNGGVEKVYILTESELQHRLTEVGRILIQSLKEKGAVLTLEELPTDDIFGILASRNTDDSSGELLDELERRFYNDIAS